MLVCLLEKNNYYTPPTSPLVRYQGVFILKMHHQAIRFYSLGFFFLCCDTLDYFNPSGSGRAKLARFF
jgi:hypothetical protein